MNDPRSAVVSVVIPMMNEVGFIEPCLDAFAAQDLGTDRLELLVVDGGSTDGCRAYVEDRARHEPWIRVLDNPARKAAAAFNVGSRAATGDVICIFSAHGVPAPSYARASVEALAATGADGVGGRYLHVGLDPQSNAIGLAMVSPFGMASPHRFASERREVDTISHPAYLAASLRAVLPFDESLERNADYELNWRMREKGMRLVFDPLVESVYRPRPSLAALGKQFWWYGRWKVRVLQRHPRSFQLRHLAAPGAVLAAAGAPALSRRRAGRLTLVALVGGYSLGVATAVRNARPGHHGASPVILAAAFPVMHAAWGSGFLASVAEDLVSRSDRP